MILMRDRRAEECYGVAGELVDEVEAIFKKRGAVIKASAALVVP